MYRAPGIFCGAPRRHGLPVADAAAAMQRHGKMPRRHKDLCVRRTWYGAGGRHRAVAEAGLDDAADEGARRARDRAVAR
jgi:hypothetical protein